MSTEKTNQSWGGRFSEPVDAFVARFTASVDFDKRLYRHDIMGSIAHATMLAKVGVLTAEERDAIEAGLKQIQAEIEAGQFDWRVDLEDVHMNIEARLTDRIGITGKKLHTGRSRNDQVATDIRLWLRDEIDIILAEITRLRRFCCHPKLALPDSTLSGSKLAAFADIADELLENGHKALVFSQFVDHLAIVRQHLDERGVRYQYLDGTTPARERKARVDAFQKGEGDIFLISLKAGGTGLNLTAADYVIHLDPWWNPAAEAQAIDRAHRIGQERPVSVYRLVSADTIEERVVRLQDRKRALFDAVVDDGELFGTTLSANDIRDMLG